MSKDELARLVARGEYVVDARAVAAALLRHCEIDGSRALRAREPGGSPSLVLVPPQPVDRMTVRAEQDEAGPGADGA